MLDFRGWACLVSAATPAACGDAIDVPEIVAAPLPVPLPVETMLTPGAVTSGFRKLSPVRGPPDEKSAKPLKFGFVIDVGESVAGWSVGGAELQPRPLAAGDLDPTNGIVTTNGVAVVRVRL